MSLWLLGLETEDTLFLSESAEVDAPHALALSVLVRPLSNSPESADALAHALSDFLGKELIEKSEEKGDVIKSSLSSTVVTVGDGSSHASMTSLKTFNRT